MTFEKEKRYCKIYLEKPELDVDPVYFEIRIPSKLIGMEHGPERRELLSLFMDTVRSDVTHVLTGHLAKVVATLIVFAFVSLGGCDDGSGLPRPGDDIDTTLCDIACVRLDECYDLASLGEDLGECIDTCDYVTQEENECLKFCDPLDGCSEWVECLEGC